MKKHVAILALATLAFVGPRPAHAAVDPLKVSIAGTDFLIPFQKVEATQLYSLKDKKGYPGIETVLVQYQKVQLTFGAAPVLGSSSNVPFVGVQFRLPRALFDVSNNEILFGAFVGKESDRKRGTWGIKASIPLW